MVAAAFEELFDSSPLPSFVSDRETLGILLVNRAACEEYGWSRDEFLALTLRDIRPDGELPAFELKYADAVKNGYTKYSRASRHRRKDGRVFDVTLEIASVTFRERPASIVVVTNVTGIAEAQRRFRLLVEHSADGISIVREDNVVEYVSPGGYRVLGYEPQEIVGTSAVTRTHPDDLSRWQPPDPGETQYHTARLRHRDGSWRWIESTTTNLTHDPAIRAYVSNYRDITERKIAADALVESQRRLEFLLSATSAVTYTARVTPDQGATFMSQNVVGVLGHSPADFHDDPTFWARNIHPDDRAGLDAKIAELMANDVATHEYRFRHRDGTYRWMRDAARLIRDDAGAPREVVGYWIDVSDQVRAASAIRRSEQNFRTLIERTPTAMLVHRDGVHVYANPAALAMLGLSDASQIIGRGALDFVHPDDHAVLRTRMKDVQKNGTTTPSVCRMLRADGSSFQFEAEAMWLDFDGKPSTVVMGRDVTERDEMFARIALADRMLSVGTLAVGVAHEINNPLAYVAANLETFERELPNVMLRPGSKLEQGTLATLINDARDGVTRITAIVRDLRALSRADQEVSTPVDVVTVLSSAIKMVHNEIRHRARIVTATDETGLLVEADPVRLGQVFINLLLNAAQAIPVGDADHHEIRIRATRARGKIHVDVTDTGSGMPSGVVRRVFDPFFTTKAGVGMGLGLAISHQIVRSLNGQITVDSEPGRGSTFSVTLPEAEDHPVVVAAEAVVLTRATCRLLIIDDEAAVGRSLEVLLAPETEVVAVTRAAQALERIAAGEQFDAILCDVMMPEISGIQLYQRLLTTAPSYEGRVIFITGGAFTPEARSFLANLRTPQLQKPFSEDQLRSALQTIMT